MCLVDPTTPLTVGDPCDDGLDCNGGDTCQEPGTGIECQHDALSPCLACEACSDTAPSGHACARNDGFCIIAGACHVRGTSPVGNVCQVCDDVGDPTAWASQPSTQACDDGSFCNGADHCDGAGACDTHDGDPCASCQTCNSGTSSCDVNSDSCYIGSTCHADGAANPANACQLCRPANIQTAWTDTTSGTACDDGSFCNGTDSCDGSGACTTHAGDPCASCQTCNDTTSSCDISAGSCYIGATCYADAAFNPVNDCQGCVAATSTTMWSDLPATTGCDDGDACTSGEACDGSGVCSGGTWICP
jgi:hypothetical protein